MINLFLRLIAYITKPHRIIGEKYLHRWYLLPRNPFINIMLHRFVGSDDDRACHCHPWWFVSFLLAGKLHETIEKRFGVRNNLCITSYRMVRRFIPVFRKAAHTHRLTLIEGPAWTVVITGPAIRSWGFWCGSRWVYWKDFVDTTGNKIGRGCD